MNPNFSMKQCQCLVATSSSSLSFYEKSVDDVLHDLLRAIQNIVAGTVTVSNNVLSENRMECSIQVSPESPIVLLRYEAQFDQKNFIYQFPVLECEESSEARGQNSNNAKNTHPIVCHNNIEDHFTLAECSVSNDDLHENENKLHESLTSSGESEFIPTLNNNCKRIVNNYVINKLKEVTTITEKKYVCEYCWKSFETKKDRHWHISIHMRDKLFKSGECDRSFTAHKNFIQHKKFHTRKRSLKCDHCYNSCFSKSHLTNHRRIHTREKPFKCEHCKKAFCRSDTLTTHKRIHTGEKPFKCDRCDKSFRFSSNFIVHKRIHTGEKPFKCDYCQKAFYESGKLIAHKRIHTGEKPFTCDHCDKSFRVSSGLIKHRRIHK